jgi:SpoVK/Ycf46/Vps4 family AAA+-type ATPase
MKSLAGLKEELLHLMRAKSPIIYIVGTDENQILKDIRDCASAIKLDSLRTAGISPEDNKDDKNVERDDSFGYYEWSATSGLSISHLVKSSSIDDNESEWTNPINNSLETYRLDIDSRHKDEDVQELIQTLDVIGLDYPKKRVYNYNHKVLVLKDIHKHLESNPFVVRRIKEIALYRDRNGIISHQIIIISPVQYIPIDFQNYVHIMQWTLPDKLEVLNYLQFELKAIQWDEKKKSFKNTKSGDYYAPNDIEGIISNFSGLSFPEIKNISNISQQKKLKLDQDLILEQKRQLILKNGILEYHSYDLSMADVGGMETFKNWVDMRKGAFSQEAKAFGIDSPKGAMLVGIQGCGKSLMAKTIAATWKVPLLVFDVGKVFGGVVGKSEENMRLAIATIEATAPNVVLIDEIEKSLAGVQSSTYSDSGTTARVMSTFLSWLNDKKVPSFVIATANNISQLPPELIRKGRFDEIFFCGLPNEEERADIFKIHLGRKGRNPSDFSIVKFVAASINFSGAEIEESIKAALISAFFNKKKDVSDADILQALDDTIPLIKTCEKDIKYLYDWVGWDDKKKDGVAARFASEYKSQLVFDSEKSKKIIDI